MSNLVQYVKNLTKYIHWILAALISAVAIIVSMNIAERTETETRKEYEHYADSMATVRHSDSVSFKQTIETMELAYNGLKTEKDSIERKLVTQTTTTKILYRTVYKDSVREVMVENSEINSVYEERISHLEDSLAQVTAKKDGTTVEYVERAVHDTIVEYRTQTDSSRVVTTIEKKDGPIGIYASGKVGYGQDGVSYGADAGIKYYIWGPLYAKGGVEYDGNVRGIVGAGVDIRF